jgi:hypothetical protein
MIVEFRFTLTSTCNFQINLTYSHACVDLQRPSVNLYYLLSYLWYWIWNMASNLLTNVSQQSMLPKLLTDLSWQWAVHLRALPRCAGMLYASNSGWVSCSGSRPRPLLSVPSWQSRGTCRYLPPWYFSTVTKENVVSTENAAFLVSHKRNSFVFLNARQRRHRDESQYH